MQRIVYIVILSIFVIDQLGNEKLIPRTATYVPELASIVTLLAILFIGAKRRVIDLGIVYWIILLVIALELLCGVVLNQVPPTTLVVGARTYLKYLPFFLLPAIFVFSDKDIRKQLQLLCVLTILQLPIALYQRFVVAANSISGDRVVGTLSISSHLSVFLICASSILTAFYLRKIIPKRAYIILLVLFLLPTTINETKGTLFLLPFGLMMPVLFMKGLGEKIKRFIVFGMIGAVFVAIYIPVYDHFRGGERISIVDYFAEGKAESYLAPQLVGEETERLGRVGLIIQAVSELSPDFTKLMLGVGIGNISPSFFGEDFDGQYYEKYGQQFIALSQLIWEIGLFGTLLLFVWWLVVAKDALYVSRRNDIAGALAFGWIGVVAVLLISLTYKNLINVNLGYLFWFYSGYIASKSYRMRRKVSRDGMARILPSRA